MPAAALTETELQKQFFILGIIMFPPNKAERRKEMHYLKIKLTNLENKARAAKAERRKAENKGDTVGAAYQLGLETAYETEALELKRYINEMPFDL